MPLARPAHLNVSSVNGEERPETGPRGTGSWGGRVDLREPSQPESESLVSEEEDEEEEEDESEEELLALRREGWLCCSVAGFSSATNKTANKNLIKRLTACFFFFPKSRFETFNIRTLTEVTVSLTSHF